MQFPPSMYTPPPFFALLPSMVQPFRVTVAPFINNAPPPPSSLPPPTALFASSPVVRPMVPPVMVTESIASPSCSAYTPPPFFALLPVRVQFIISMDPP